jgi:hypothetical protein
MIILHKKTFQKFGYWPNNLSPGTNYRVLVKCAGCGVVRTLVFGKLKNLKTGYCLPCVAKLRRKSPVDRKCSKCDYVRTMRPYLHKITKVYTCRACATSIGTRKAADVRRSNFFLKYQNETATPQIIHDILLRYSLGKNNTNCDRMTLRCRNNVNDCRYITLEQSIKLLCSIQCREEPLTTKEMRDAALQYTLDQNKDFTFKVVNLFLENYYFYATKNKLAIAANPYFLALCSSLNFKYTLGKGIRRLAYFSKCSFFIDNKWIHIG